MVLLWLQTAILLKLQTRELAGGPGGHGAQPPSFNFLTLYTGFIALLLNIMEGVLDESISYQMVWVGAPLTLVLYVLGLGLWFIFARCVYRSRASHYWEDAVAFVLFTINILWLYTKQATLLWDTWMDGELFRAVAWAHARLAPTTCNPRRPPGHLPRVQVMAGKGFPTFAQWRALWPELIASTELRRVLQAVTLFLAALYDLPVMFVFFFNYHAAVMTVRCMTHEKFGGADWAGFQESGLAVVNMVEDIVPVLPRVPAWGLWKLSQGLSNASALALLRDMTGEHLNFTARAAAEAVTGLDKRANETSARQLLLTTVVLLANNVTDAFDWDAAALAPAAGQKLADLWALR